MGKNLANVSGVSWKLWKIERAGRSLTTWWGSAKLVSRCVVPSGALQSKTWRFTSEADAKISEAERIKEKLDGGYERSSGRTPNGSSHVALRQSKYPIGV